MITDNINFIRSIKVLGMEAKFHTKAKAERKEWQQITDTLDGFCILWRVIRSDAKSLPYFLTREKIFEILQPEKDVMKRKKERFQCRQH